MPLAPRERRKRNEHGPKAVVPQRRLVWTDALESGFRPSRSPAHLGFRFTAAIAIEAQGKGTRYTATVMHGDAQSRDKHESMGFFDGWGTSFEQLVAYKRRCGPELRRSSRWAWRAPAPFARLAARVRRGPPERRLCRAGSKVDLRRCHRTSAAGGGRASYSPARRAPRRRRSPRAPRRPLGPRA